MKKAVLTMSALLMFATPAFAQVMLGPPGITPPPCPCLPQATAATSRHLCCKRAKARYRAVVSNCDKNVITMTFTRKLTSPTRYLSEVSPYNHPLALALKKTGGVRSFLMRGREVQIVKHERVSAETVVANAARTVGKYFGGRTLPSHPMRTARFRCRELPEGVRVY